MSLIRWFFVARPKALIITFAFCSAFDLPTTLAQDSCKDILVSGVHNTYSKATSGSEPSYLYHALCDNRGGSTSQGNSAGGGVNYAGIGLNFNSGSQSASTFQSSICSKEENSVSSEDYDSLMTATVDPGIVQNWKECMEGRNGLFANVDVNDDQVTFTLEWKAFGGLNEVTVTSPPNAFGVTCPNSIIKPGLVLKGSVQVTDLCRRTDNGPVTYVVNTTAGSKTLKLSKVKGQDYGPPMPQAVQVTITARKTASWNPNAWEYDGFFIVPSPGPAASSFNFWRLGRTTIINGEKSYGEGGHQDGDWQTGDHVSFQVFFPKNAIDPNQGNEARFCVGVKGAGGQLSDNILTLPVP